MGKRAALVLIGMVASFGMAASWCVAMAAEPVKPVKPAPPLPTYQELFERAKSDMKTKEGKPYDLEIGQKFARGHREAVTDCVKSNGSAPYRPLNFIVVVDKEGAVSRVLVDGDSPAALCIFRLLLAEKFPKPPFAPFHDLMEMTFE